MCDAKQLHLDDIESSQKHACNDSSICAICLESIGATINEPNTCLPCSHVFHSTCIIGYFISCKTTQCPLCRQRVLPTDDHDDNQNPLPSTLQIVSNPQQTIVPHLIDTSRRESTTERIQKVAVFVCLFLGAALVVDAFIGFRVYRL